VIGQRRRLEVAEARRTPLARLELQLFDDLWVAIGIFSGQHLIGVRKVSQISSLVHEVCQPCVIVLVSGRRRERHRPSSADRSALRVPHGHAREDVDPGRG
jgi:hypothetical protein